MPASDIEIRGAREHNLRDVDLILPRNQLICLTGVSGSGKSSLAFDTVYAEGQRRYVESLSSFARQFLGQMPKPDVDYIGGLSPSISISQKSSGNNPRSTVGTITEIHDYLRVLYARVGTGHCPECGTPISAQTREQIIHRILHLPDNTPCVVLAPVIRAQKGEHKDLFQDLLRQGFVRARVDGRIVRLTDDLQLDRQMRHDIEVVVDRLTIRRDNRARLAETVDLALKMGQGNMIVHPDSGDASDAEDGRDGGQREKTQRRSRVKRAGVEGDIIFSVSYACGNCGVSFNPPSPQLFSFNSPQGMCLECDGLGEAFTFDVDLLVPEPRLSVKKGAIALLGKWSEIGRWRRHLLQGVADSIERKWELKEGTLLTTPWNEMPQEHRDVWLWGTADEHITFTWRRGSSPIMHGGKFEGIIPDLLSRYRNSRNRMQRLRLEKYMRTQRCPACGGRRLNAQARAVKITTAHRDLKKQPALSLPEVSELSIADAANFFSKVVLDDVRAVIAESALKEIRGRLQFLQNVGLDYLTLARTAPTLSGGESQRIRLASQIGCGLVGVLYILDEPSIGLHPRDNDRLLTTLAQLRDVGNTVLVVEHDEDTMRHSDYLIDFGPGPGVRGGRVVAQGSVNDVMRAKDSITGKYLSGELAIQIPPKRRPGNGKWLKILGARQNNLKNANVDIPLGEFVCVTGVSGSGKSSIVNDILVEVLRRDLNGGDGDPGLFDAIAGLEHLDKMIAIDQSPIGRTPRSNPGTYIKVFDEIRSLFTQLPDAKKRGYKPGRFSFNVQGGRCEACEGNGSNRLEMDFLADVWVTCPVCEGHRFNRETLGVRFKERSISDILEMDVQQALELFENIPSIRAKLQTLHDVGLDYIKIGQPSPTLSGGEAQRIKLARELVKRSTGKTLYLLDEPTTGLHFADIQMLLKVLHDFVDAGNTVLVVEHNLDVVKTADWVIDLGPEGGDGGGCVIATGTPEEIAKNPRSYTGKALAPLLKPKRKVKPATSRGKKNKIFSGVTLAQEIDVRGARQHNLQDVSVSIPRDQMTVFCGPSGSGKSSLAMDTIYAEGQRRYVESLSSYARQFVSQMQKPQLEHIEGLSPAIAIEQQNQGQTPRSTVGTSTEIYDYLRILLARLGTPHCPDCDLPVGTQTSDQVTDKVMSHPSGTRLYLMAPLSIEVGQEYAPVWDELRAAGYLRVRVDNKTYTLDEVPEIDRRRRHRVEAIVDRIVVQPSARGRIAESVEGTLGLGRGTLHIAVVDENIPEEEWIVTVHSQHLACHGCGRSFERLTPHSFSFNSYLGWCPACEGLGVQRGANPAALLRSPKLTLADGAILLWPNLEHSVARDMLEAFGKRMGIPLDVPFEQLAARERRILFHGTGDTWFDVYQKSNKKNPPLAFRFQFKGLYPALEEASRLSPSLRSRLDYLIDEVDCSACGGSRLREDAAAVRYRNQTVDQLCRMPLGELLQTVRRWKLDRSEQKIAGELLREIRSRLEFLVDVGLDYLSLGRPAASLSGGEAQRIRLASQLGSGLCGVLYVLDEPTIGLHPRDNRRLLHALHKLRDLGNTLVLVEHDREVIEGSDFLLDFGPRAGKNGGQVVAQGTPSQVGKRASSVTGPYLSGRKAIPVPKNRRSVNPCAKEIQAIWNQLPGTPRDCDATAPPATNGKREAKKNKRTAKTPQPTATAEIAIETRSWPDAPVDWLIVRGAQHHNLKRVDVPLPLGRFTAITGPSGSGKSSLVDDILYRALARQLHRAATIPGAYDAIEGIEHINKVIRVDQQPLGNSPTSNPATYTAVFDLIRNLFAQLPESKLRGYTPRRFSFNVPGGRCEACEGNGQICIEMHFLPDVWIPCEACNGTRYNPETLSVKYRGQSIADVLQMTAGDALKLFDNLPKIRRVMQTLCDVGLDYLTLGQAAPTLSGGEAQRVKLAAELSRPDTGRTLYLLDEPTTGLHFDDLAKLLEVLQRLVDLGNTVVVIEHNLDVIKSTDWVIDMGPEAGDGGGTIVAMGTPEHVVAQAQAMQSGNNKQSPQSPQSYTGQALSPVLAAGPLVERQWFDPAVADQVRADDLEIEDVGKQTKMPWESDGRRWHTIDRVGRAGEACKWDGRILGAVVDYVQDREGFAETNWNSRTIVEVTGAKKNAGWFLHALTGEAWMLKLKFRIPRNTFDPLHLQNTLPLKTLNEMVDLPVYGNEPRVTIKNVHGAWQEVQIRAHSFDEIDVPAFWEFVNNAVDAFQNYALSMADSSAEIMPWKKLGERWHMARKGFPMGQPPKWDVQLLHQVVQLLQNVSPTGRFEWTNQVIVHHYLPGKQEPWATLETKRPDYVGVILRVPKQSVALGSILELGSDRAIDGSRAGAWDVVRIQFQTLADLQRGDLQGLLTRVSRELWTT